MGTILLIENDKLLQNAFRRVLRGHDVTVVADGLEALALFSDEKRYDVIISDYDLNGPLTGEDVFLWVQANRPDLVSKYIFCSSNERSERFCETRGITCLLKPALPQDIVAAVKTVMGASL